MNLFITWDVTPEIIEGWKTPNYYGLLFVSGLMIGYFVVKRMYKREGIHEKFLDQLVLYTVIATIVGARLGHVFFYGPYWDVIDANGVVLQEGYLSNPMSIIKVWEGGLASHGGAIAILLALWLYSKYVVKLPMMWILDRIVVGIAVAGCFIRLGNLMNSEIVGIPTDVPWAFSFPNFWNDELKMYDSTPRHAAQLYEAIAYIFSFGILMFLYWKKKFYQKRGVVFGAFLILIFGARFLIEFIKLGQTERDDTWALNTGQILSIPLVLAGIYILWRGLKRDREETNVEHLKVVEEKKK
ncbi:MAG: prolipoprotein diacylglyceryl transferase [Crocinitomicaceae bacterium]|nr:prolipoprotein diacylglyceryl transferase [Crocinitomicaceae bacterium]